LRTYNADCKLGTLDHSMLDDRHTVALTQSNTHRALPLDTPPIYSYALRPGITFTYLGVKIDQRAAVHFSGTASPNLFAAGEVSAGNVLGKGYLAGIGVTIGTAFGRIAGVEAARAALTPAAGRSFKGATRAAA